MPSWFDVGNIWKTLREIDLRPIRDEAERLTWIAVVGGSAAARSSFIDALCVEPRETIPSDDASRAGPEPLSIDLAAAPREPGADLVVLILNSDGSDQQAAETLYRAWRDSGKKVVVVYNASEIAGRLNPGAFQDSIILRGPAGDPRFLADQFVPVVLSLLPDRYLSLARYYPVFRTSVAQHLISDTAMANANYALTTGLAEVIPILDVPFNIADMIILTKNQAIMAYKLGLALGLSARWQDHMTAFGGTVGSGFVWRQLARQLIGLVPIWGLVPKVAVSFAGTYVLGQAIMQWYVTGQKATPAAMRQFYRDALDQGKKLAGSLLARAPRGQRLSLPAVPHLRLPSRIGIRCARCGGSNPVGNHYCGNCGSPLGAKQK